MLTFRIVTLGLGLIVALMWNFAFAPQIMTPRAPVFNGPDIASNWEWRSMAIDMHGWWLWSEIPDASVKNVGFVPPPDNPEGLRVGIQFDSYIDDYLGLNVDSTEPPFDVTGLKIRDQLHTHAKNYSRIHCRDNQAMAIRDTCYYFVSWDWDLLPKQEPEFYAVRTYLDHDSEIALVEKNLLEALTGVSVDTLPNFHEVDPQ